jgi:hypothetical protein
MITNLWRTARQVRPHAGALVHAGGVSRGFVSFEQFRAFGDLETNGIVSNELTPFRRLRLFNTFSSHLQDKICLAEFVEGASASYLRLMELMHSQELADEAAGRCMGSESHRDLQDLVSPRVMGTFKSTALQYDAGGVDTKSPRVELTANEVLSCAIIGANVYNNGAALRNAHFESRGEETAKLGSHFMHFVYVCTNAK